MDTRPLADTLRKTRATALDVVLRDETRESLTRYLTRYAALGWCHLDNNYLAQTVALEVTRSLGELSTTVLCNGIAAIESWLLREGLTVKPDYQQGGLLVTW